MESPEHARTGVVVAFAGAGGAAWGLFAEAAPTAVPSWAWGLLALVAFLGGLFLSWPRPVDEERIEREVQERLLRHRARQLGKDWVKADSPGRASTASRRFQGSATAGAKPGQERTEADQVRDQIRKVQREIQEAGVRLGLKKISKEGYTALVTDLQKKRAALENKLIDLERRAIEQP